MSDTVLVGLLAGVFGALGAIIPAWWRSRNAPSRRVFDTASIVDASGHVIATLREEIQRLDAELDEARVEVTELRRRTIRLEQQVRALGHTPVNGP